MTSVASTPSVPAADKREITFKREDRYTLYVSVTTDQMLPRIPDARVLGQVGIRIGTVLPKLSEFNIHDADAPQPSFKGSVLNIVIEYDRLVDPDYFQALKWLLGRETLFVPCFEALGLPLHIGEPAKDVPGEFVEGLLARYMTAVREATA
jgi:hypothetical protein